MFARVSTSAGTFDFDHLAAVLRDHIVLQLNEQPGFLGLSASADRQAGIVGAVTLWETKRDVVASDLFADRLRRQVVEELGDGEVQEVRVLEQAIWEAGENLPEPGSHLLITSLKMAPARVEENLAFFHASVVPEIRSTRGFRSLRYLITRGSGEGLVATAWDDELRLEAFLRTLSGLDLLLARGVQFREQLRREVIFSALQAA